MSCGDEIVEAITLNGLKIGDMVTSKPDADEEFPGEATIERFELGTAYVSRHDGVTGGGHDGTWFIDPKDLEKVEEVAEAVEFHKGDIVVHVEDCGDGGSHFSGQATFRKINKNGKAVVEREDGITGDSPKGYWLSDLECLRKA